MGNVNFNDKIGGRIKMQINRFFGLYKISLCDVETGVRFKATLQVTTPEGCRTKADYINRKLFCEYFNQQRQRMLKQFMSRGKRHDL